MSDESIAEALKTVRTGAGEFAGGVVTQKRVGTGAVDVLHDGSVEASERRDPDEGTDNGGRRTGAANDDTEAEHADPFWGEVLDDEAAMVEQPLTAAQVLEHYRAAGEHHAAAEEAEGRVEMLKESAKEANKRAKEVAAAAAVRREKGDLAMRSARSATAPAETMCPVRLRVIDDERVVVVLHPGTGEVVEQRDLTDDDRQLKLTGADEAEGIDRVQIRARLSLLEDALSISRGVHAVPPQSEIDAWATGVCKATVEWLDSIDVALNTGEADLKPLPVWVSGVRVSEQGSGSYFGARDQIETLTNTLHLGSIYGLDDDADNETGRFLSHPPKGSTRVDLPGLVATMKRQQTVGGTSQHLTAVLRVAGDFGGVPQLKAAVADADGALLRQLHYIAKCKPAPDGVADEDVRPTVIAAIERTLEVAS